MISQITFWVEHGETTDPLDTFITLAAGLPECADGLEDLAVITSDFIVDVPSPVVSLAEVESLMKGLSWELRARMEDGKPIE